MEKKNPGQGQQKTKLRKLYNLGRTAMTIFLNMKYSRGGPHCMFFIKRNRAVQKNLQREEKQQSKRKTQGRDSKTKTKLRKLYNLGKQDA